MPIAVPDLYALDGPSYYPLHDLLAELRRVGARTVRLPGGSGESNLAKASERLRLNRAGPRRRKPMLVPLMGYKPFSLFPYTYRYDLVLFCWDVWEPDYARWLDLLDRHRPRIVFVTARQSAEYLQRFLPTTEVLWMPEAASVETSSAVPLAVRGTHVLELGRRHASYHDAIVDELARSPWDHRFERERGSIVYPTRRDLHAGLADAVVSVCFPSSVTHPERSGAVSTMTQRYLETMLSGALPVGQAPQELISLFGYNPVIDVDCQQPWGQLKGILQDPGQWQELADRNKETARQVGTWTVRVMDVRGVLVQHFPALAF